jgi:hypothetical protein
LADFSGYLAADELYDGPFCVLCCVLGTVCEPLRDALEAPLTCG